MAASAAAELIVLGAELGLGEEDDVALLPLPQAARTNTVAATGANR